VERLDPDDTAATGYPVRLTARALASALGAPGDGRMACDDEIIPSQERIENVADDADLEVVYDTERHLLYHDARSLSSS
jgi:hypothetical protein